jgi:hypothetical protein
MGKMDGGKTIGTISVGLLAFMGVITPPLWGSMLMIMFVTSNIYIPTMHIE